MNQRRRIRVEAQKDATLEWGGQNGRGKLVNVSLKGCLVDLAGVSGPSAGKALRVIIHLEDDSPDLDIVVQGVVARVLPEGVAVDFSEISPESFQHLFRLVQYNAPNPEEVEGELGSKAFDTPR